MNSSFSILYEDDHIIAVNKLNNKLIQIIADPPAEDMLWKSFMNIL